MNLPGIADLVNGGTGKGVIPESMFLSTLLSKFFVNDKCHVKIAVASLSREKASKAQIF